MAHYCDKCGMMINTVNMPCSNCGLELHSSQKWIEKKSERLPERPLLSYQRTHRLSQFKKFF